MVVVRPAVCIRGAVGIMWEYQPSHIVVRVMWQMVGKRETEIHGSLGIMSFARVTMFTSTMGEVQLAIGMMTRAWNLLSGHV